jgi:hypothetical protein
MCQKQIDMYVKYQLPSFIAIRHLLGDLTQEGEHYKTTTIITHIKFTASKIMTEGNV